MEKKFQYCLNGFKETSYLITSCTILDKDEKVTSQRIVSFEDPEDLIKFLTKTKKALVADNNCLILFNVLKFFFFSKER